MLTVGSLAKYSEMVSSGLNFSLTVDYIHASFSSHIQVKGHSEFYQTLNITLNVTDVDDKNPKFDKTHYTGSISESVRLFVQIIFSHDNKLVERIYYN